MGAPRRNPPACDDCGEHHEGYGDCPTPPQSAPQDSMSVTNRQTDIDVQPFHCLNCKAPDLMTPRTVGSPPFVRWSCKCGATSPDSVLRWHAEQAVSA